MVSFESSLILDLFLILLDLLAYLKEPSAFSLLQLAGFIFKVITVFVLPSEESYNRPVNLESL